LINEVHDVSLFGDSIPVVSPGVNATLLLSFLEGVVALLCLLGGVVFDERDVGEHEADVFLRDLPVAIKVEPSR